MTLLEQLSDQYYKAALKYNLPEPVSRELSDFIIYAKMPSMPLYNILISNLKRLASTQVDNLPIRTILTYLYEVAPMQCWGQKESVLIWRGSLSELNRHEENIKRRQGVTA